MDGSLLTFGIFCLGQLKDLLGVEEEWEEACREGREMTEELARMRADVSSMETRIDQCEPTLR